MVGAGVLAAVAAVGGCAADQGGTSAPAPSGEAPSSAVPVSQALTTTPVPTTTPPPPPAGPCGYTLSPTRFSSESIYGGLSVSGGDGRVLCGSGPYLGVHLGPGAGITVAADGAPVRLGQGDTAQVGPYQVRVLGVAGDTVRFELSNPDA